MNDVNPLTNPPANRFPVFVLVAAFGLLVTSLGMIANIHHSPFAMLIFWGGILIITLPIGMRILNPDIHYREALALVVLAGEMLFLASVLLPTSQLSTYDGLLHWRTASDILNTGHLFTPNSLLPISPYYPGLEIVTTAVVNLTQLSIFQAGYLVVAVARAIMLASLFMILFQLTESVRAAGAGVMIYMGSTTFVFFDSQFAYESLSLPLTALVIWFVLKRSYPAHQTGRAWITAAVLVTLMIAITHHVTSYILAGILLVWTVIAAFRNRRGANDYVPGRLTLSLILFIVAWTLLIGNVTIGYLGPYLSDTLATLMKFIAGYQGDRAILPTGQANNALSTERIVSLLSVLFLLIGEGLGLVTWLRSVRKNFHLRSTLAVALVLTSLAYPVLPLLHLQSSTWEVGNRLAGVVFIGLAFVIGLGVAAVRRKTLLHILRLAAFPALAVIICAGVIGGSDPTTRLPGPYLVEADGRSLDSFSVAAADWARANLGPNNRMAGDREQSLIMGSFGGQSIVYGGNIKISLSPIFLDPTLGAIDTQIIKFIQIRYLVIDTRILLGPPLSGYYFESWERSVVKSPVPVNPAAITKFDHIPNVNRIYDNGFIRIYDMGGLNID